MFSSDREEARNDLADRLSEVQDGRLDHSSLEAQFCDEPFQVTSSPGADEGPALAALGNYDEGLTTFDAVARACAFEDQLLDPLQAAVQRTEGTSWPTPYTDPVYTSNGTELQSADLGTLGVHEWEWQAKLTRNLTSLSGLSQGGADDELEALVGGSALDGLGALAEAQPSNPKVKAFRKVVASAALAGTADAGKTARDLILKSQRIASLADDRAKAALEARAGYKRSLKEVEMLDARARMLARQLLDENGEPRKDTTLMDIARLKKLRERSIALGRRAIRYQKVNALATPLADNGIAQAALLQMTASTVLTGDVGAAAALGSMYHAIGKKSEQIRGVREKQLEKWEKKSELDGYEGCISQGDPYEAALNGIELADLQYFAALEGRFFRKLKRKVKKAVKKVGKGVKSVAKTTGSITKRLVRATVVAPIKGTVGFTSNIVRGRVKQAFKSVANSVKSSAKDIANVAGRVFLDWPCKVASSKIASAAIQAATQAVGTAYGGTVGGAVGKEAGRQAYTINKSVCGGMRNLGITKGTFRPGRVKSTFKKVGKKIYNTSFSPKALLGAAMRIGSGAISGGVGSYSPVSLDSSKLLSQFGGKALNQLGVGKLVGRANLLQKVAPRLTSRVTSRAKSQVARRVKSAVTRRVKRGLTRRVSKIVPGVRYAQQAAQFARNPNYAQAVRFAQQQAQQRAQQFAQRQAQQLIPQAAQQAQGFFIPKVRSIVPQARYAQQASQFIQQQSYPAARFAQGVFG